jgi:hypothetical protein
MKSHYLYKGFIQFEERSAELYLDLSARFFDKPELKWFWIEMAMEEKQHAGMLQHCCEAEVFASDLPGKTEVQNLNRLFVDLERRAKAETLSVDDAFGIAIDLESSEINDIFNKLTAPIDGPVHKLKKKMELSVGGHFEKLQVAAVEFGASTEIQKRLEDLSVSVGPGNLQI